MNSHAATLRVAAFPRANLITDVLLVLAGTGLSAASAQLSVKLPFTPVPITGQTFAVVLVGASLGSLRGTASATVYLWLGVAGAPIYAHHASGWDVITNASGGYIVGFVLAAAAAGFLAERGWDRNFVTCGAAMIAGHVAISLSGVVWLAILFGTTKAIDIGLVPFLASSALKTALATAAMPLIWRIVARDSARHWR